MSEPTNQTPEGGMPLVGDNPTYFDEPVQDALVNMIMELAAQVWVNRERMSALEAVLEDAGQLNSDAVESYQPTADQAAARRVARDSFVADILREIQRLAPPGR